MTTEIISYPDIVSVAFKTKTIANAKRTFFQCICRSIPPFIPPVPITSETGGDAGFDMTSEISLGILIAVVNVLHLVMDGLSSIQNRRIVSASFSSSLGRVEDNNENRTRFPTPWHWPENSLNSLFSPMAQTTDSVRFASVNFSY